MFSKIAIKTATAAAGIAAAGILTPAASSADSNVLSFGETAELSSPGGAEAAEYTVSNLQPSGNNDGVWYSDVTVKADRGSPTPKIAEFKARATNGSTYAVMRGNQPDGLPNGPVADGTQVTGRLYFSVLQGSTPPDSVVYRDGADKLVWKD